MNEAVETLSPSCWETASSGRLAGRQSARKDFDAHAHAHMSRSDDMVRSQKPEGAGSSLPGNR